ncbi:glycosyltransferase family 4 protein [Methylotenera sp.]|uniref:glycosyltransferase family 4 protein n=1 Tax=Methylotenera sp. TaxID=2051956 RepID=UPI002731A11E|nr:glycosyltransferase family 4 protein [Methylotenera sp.]MDP2229625.1 glycosyltransferase family 4 protein [Methylotenera sp.]
MRLFYFVTDSYPAWRVDLAELFSHELKQFGLHTDWSMRRDDSGIWCAIEKNGETIYLPFFLSGIPIVTPIARRFGEFMSEIYLTGKLIFGPRYDFIQVRDDRYTAAFFAWLAAKIRGSKFIYWVSFPFPENDLEKAKLSTGLRKAFFQLRGNLTMWWLYKIVLPRADHVFVQTERMKQNIMAYGLAKSKMTPVAMGVSMKLFEWKRTAKHEVERGSVTYLGTFARSRHLETIIQAFALVILQLPSAKLYLVGRGDIPQDRQFLEELVKQSGLSNNVIFTGFLPIDEAWAVAAKSEICISPIYPSFIHLQSSPTKLYEYMALGRPVIGNDHPEQSNALASSGAGLCVPWNEQSFANAMIYMLMHTDDAQKMGEKGPEWVEENRRYDHIAALVYRQYQVLLDK